MKKKKLASNADRSHDEPKSNEPPAEVESVQPNKSTKRKHSKMDATIDRLEAAKTQPKRMKDSATTVRRELPPGGESSQAEFYEDGNLVFMEADGIHTDFIGESDSEGEINEEENGDRRGRNNNVTLERNCSRSSSLATGEVHHGKKNKQDG